ALAAVAGALVAPLAKVVTTMGANYLAPSFFVVIVGGAGSLPGVVAGSALVGFIQTVLDYQIPATFSQALVLILSVAIVRFRPRGLIPASPHRRPSPQASEPGAAGWRRSQLRS